MSLIRYYRTTPGSHWVKADSLEWGDTLPPGTMEGKPAPKRQEMKPVNLGMKAFDVNRENSNPVKNAFHPIAAISGS